MRKILIAAVKMYQAAVSPFLGKNCRFEPSCSGYFEQALAKKKLSQAFTLGFKRILKCHPFHPGGFDPVA